MKILKKRWYSIPVVSLVGVLLGLALITGGVAAAMGWCTFVTGTAVVTVDEAIVVTILPSYEGVDSDGEWDGSQETRYTWTVSLLAGETRTLWGKAENLSSVDLWLVGEVSNVPPGLTVHSGALDSTLTEPWPLASGTTQVFPIQITADTTAATGTFYINFAFSRQ